MSPEKMISFILLLREQTLRGFDKAAFDSIRGGKTMSKARGRTLADRRFRFTSEDRWGYFFIFVAMVVFVTFTLYPVVSAVRTSFLKYKPFGSEFIGLKNYIDTFKSALFYKAVKNTIVYTAVVVPLSLLIAFSIAIMILPFKKKNAVAFQVRLLSARHRLGRGALGRVAVAVRLLAGRPFQSGADVLRHPVAELALQLENVHALADAHGDPLRTGQQHHHLHSRAPRHRQQLL